MDPWKCLIHFWKKSEFSSWLAGTFKGIKWIAGTKTNYGGLDASNVSVGRKSGLLSFRSEVVQFNID